MTSFAKHGTDCPRHIGCVNHPIPPHAAAEMQAEWRGVGNLIGDVGGGVQVPMFGVLGHTFDLDSGMRLHAQKQRGKQGTRAPESLPHFFDKKSRGGT